MTVDQRPHAPNPPRAGLVLPATLTPTWRELPRSGWVLARAFSPRRGNTALATVVWLPWTGQLVAARCYHGAAVWAGKACPGRCHPARIPPTTRHRDDRGPRLGSPPWPGRSWPPR